MKKDGKLWKRKYVFLSEKIHYENVIKQKCDKIQLMIMQPHNIGTKLEFTGLKGKY